MSSSASGVMATYPGITRGATPGPGVKSPVPSPVKVPTVPAPAPEQDNSMPMWKIAAISTVAIVILVALVFWLTKIGFFQHFF